MIKVVSVVDLIHRPLMDADSLRLLASRAEAIEGACIWCLNNSLTSSSPHASTFGLKHSCALYKHDHIGFHAMRVALARAMKRRGALRLLRADARLDA